MSEKAPLSEEIIEDCKQFVMQYFDEHSESHFTYHNWNHTLSVFNAAVEIAEATPEINQTQKDQLCLAAIFHDATYAAGPENHEIRSADLAGEQLSKYTLSPDFIKEVKRIILATKKEYEAKDLVEKVIRDADLAHLGKDTYIERSFQNLANEMRASICPEMSERDWIIACIDFLDKHEYQTDYAKKNFSPTKKKNLDKLRNMQEAITPQGNIDTPEEKTKAKKNKPKKTKDENPYKGVETMFKTALRNHVDLSSIADQKANTLISVNAIIISIVLSALFPKLDSNPFMFYPSVTILASCFLTVLLAILSTIPNISRGRIDKDQVLAKKGNLLFFGNFYKMNISEFEWSINELMHSKEYIYNTMTRDLYFLGKVLNKKYLLLRYSYYTFIFGLLASIIVFIWKVFPVIGTTVTVPVQ